MKKVAVAFLMICVLIMSACNAEQTGNERDNDPSDGVGENVELPGDSPPEVSIEVDGERHGTKLGAYCWDIEEEGDTSTTECVDAAGATELLSDGDAIQVKPGEKVKIEMDYTPKPNEIHLTQHKPSEEIELDDDTFTAPDEKGLYYYDYQVWWNDEEDEHISYGDASYAFVLEVK